MAHEDESEDGAKRYVLNSKELFGVKDELVVVHGSKERKEALK